MSKEQLKQIEIDYKNAFPINIEWLIEYAKEQAEQVDSMAHVIKVKGKEMRELSDFLKNRNIPLKVLSSLVTVMSYVQELEKDLSYEKQALINQEKSADREIHRLRQQNKHYRNLLESIRYTPEIAKEIHQEYPDKKVIDANDLLQHVLRKINAELERESE